jgi:hypothetical protein
MGRDALSFDKRSGALLSMGLRYTVKLSGDVGKVKSLVKQINFAAKQTVIAVAQEAQGVVIETITKTFHIRGTWYVPSQRFGIHVRFSKDRSDLTARLETAADWLEEHETGEDKHPDKHDGHLTVPHAARPSIESIVPAANKARRILPNVSELATRRLLFTSGRRSKSQGRRAPKFKEAPFFMNRAGTAIFERLPDRRLKLFYTLTNSSSIKKQSTVIEPTITVVQERFGPLFNDKLRVAFETAK